MQIEWNLSIGFFRALALGSADRQRRRRTPAANMAADSRSHSSGIGRGIGAIGDRLAPTERSHAEPRTRAAI